MLSGCQHIPLESLTHNPNINHALYLRLAKTLACKAALGEKCGDLYGAVIVDRKDGSVIAEGYDRILIDPTGTAAISAIRFASRLLQTTDLSDCIMFLSTFPPLIDSFAITNANIRDVYYVGGSLGTKKPNTIINRTTYHPVMMQGGESFST